jgi:hypothetical protein
VINIIQREGYNEVWDVIQRIESRGYEWSDEEETKSEIRSLRRVTPHVKDALLVFQSMGAMMNQVTVTGDLSLCS